LNQLHKTLGFLPTPVLVPIIRLYISAKEYTLNTPAAQLAPVGLVGIMGIVFLAWKVPRLEPFMRKWWLHRPVVLGGRVREWQNCVTLFTSIVRLRYPQPSCLEAV
jgi:rhomboid-like protein